MLRKNNRRNYMRTEAPEKPRKKICKKRCSEKITLKKRYENRCSEQQQKKNDEKRCSGKNSEKNIREQVLGQQKHRQNDMRTYALKKPRQNIEYYAAAGRDTGITSIVHNCT